MEINENRIDLYDKDNRIKIGLINYGNALLSIEGIEEEIEEIDEISLERNNVKLDFRAKLKSGKILVVKCEKNKIEKETLEKILKYSKEIYYKTRKDVITIIISLFRGKNEYRLNCGYCLKFEPHIFPIKQYDGEGDLEKYKNKVQKEIAFTEGDYNWLISIPEMYFEREISEVVEELCHIIKDGIIPEKYRRKMKTVINLSIDYYIDDEEKKEELKNMLKMDDAFLSEYNILIRDVKNEGIKEGELNNIKSIKEEISKNQEITVDDIVNIIEEKERMLSEK